MNIVNKLLTLAFLLLTTVLLVGCSSSGVRGSASYSVYGGYHYPHYGYGGGYYRPPYNRPNRPNRPHRPRPEHPIARPPGNIGRPVQRPSRPISRPRPRPMPRARSRR